MAIMVGDPGVCGAEAVRRVCVMAEFDVHDGGVGSCDDKHWWLYCRIGERVPEGGLEVSGGSS